MEGPEQRCHWPGWALWLAIETCLDTPQTATGMGGSQQIILARQRLGATLDGMLGGNPMIWRGLLGGRCLKVDEALARPGPSCAHSMRPPPSSAIAAFFLLIQLKVLSPSFSSSRPHVLAESHRPWLVLSDVELAGMTFMRSSERR
jgi:hypothetical protein